MTTPVLYRFSQSLQALEPDFQEKKYLIALSGGLDSMVLYHLALAQGLDVAVAHLNYQLREESQKDAEFVKEVAQKNNVPFYIKSLDTRKEKPNGESVQMFARRVRYQFFQELQEQYPYDYVLTAHHQDDLVETFLINLLRANSLQGLSSIPAKNGTRLRPLLSFSKSELKSYAQNQSIDWREDSSNQDSYYRRNFIRNEVLTLLESQFPESQQNIAKSIACISQAQNYILEHTQNDFEKLFKNKGNAVQVDKMDILNKSPIEYLQWFDRWGFHVLEEIQKFFTAHTGSAFHSNTHSLYVDRESFYIFKKEELPKPLLPNIIKELPFVQKHPFFLELIEDNKALDKADIILDNDKLHFPIMIRSKKEGDVLYPSQFSGKKTLSKFFKDEKIPIFEKNSIPVLVDAHEQVVAVLGYRIDRRFEVDAKTKKYLNIFL